MNSSYIVASALAAAIVAPAVLSAQKPAPAPTLQGREVLRHRQGRQERLRLDRQQLVRRLVEG